MTPAFAIVTAALLHSCVIVMVQTGTQFGGALIGFPKGSSLGIAYEANLTGEVPNTHTYMLTLLDRLWMYEDCQYLCCFMVDFLEW